MARSKGAAPPPDPEPYNKVGDAVAKTTGWFTKLTSTVKSFASGAATKARSAVGALSEKVTEFADNAVPADSAVGSLAEALAGLGPYGQAAAVALKLVTVAVTALVQTLWEAVKAAISISQEKDALVATFGALSDGAMDARALVDEISEVAAELPQAEGAVLAWAKSLMAAGIQGEELKESVRAVAGANALMGAEGGAAAEKLIKRFAMAAELGQKIKLDRRILQDLARAGVSATTLAKQLGVPAEKLGSMSIDADKLWNSFQKGINEKAGPALEAMSLTWTSISGKLSDAFEDLWEDMGEFIQPFMREVKDLFGEFLAGTTAQSTAKGILTAIFRELFEVATKVTHAVHLGFLHMYVAALKVAIAVAPLVKTLRSMASTVATLAAVILTASAKFAAWLATLIPLEHVFTALKAVLGLVAIALGVVISIVVLFIAAIGGIALVIGGVAAAVMQAVLWIVGAIIDGFGAAGRAIGAWASSAWEAAGNFISGLVGGISAGAGAVVDAVKGLASKATSAFKSMLGIASPSKVFAEFGGYTAEGFAQGVERGAPKVEAATASMGIGAALAGRPSRDGGKGSSGGAVSATFGPGSVVIHAGDRHPAEVWEEALALVLERLAAKEGLATT